MPTPRLVILDLPNALDRPVTHRHHLTLRGSNTRQELIGMYALLSLLLTRRYKLTQVGVLPLFS